MKKSFFLFVLALIIMLGSTVFAANSLKVQNPGFEEVKSGKLAFWTQSAWDSKPGTTTFSFDNKIFHSGKRSAVITNSKPNDARYTQVMKVQPNTLYKLSCWVKTENVGKKEKGADISVEGILYTSAPEVNGTTDWKKVNLYGRTLSGQTTLTLTVGLGGYGTVNTGKAWFDDVTIEKIDKTPTGVEMATLGQPTNNSNNNNNSSSASTNNFSYIYLLIILVIVVIIIISFFINKNNKKRKELDENNSDFDSDQKSEEEKEEITEQKTEKLEKDENIDDGNKE